MNNNEKLAVLEEILCRAAEQLGDITPIVLERFFARSPGSKALFDHHGGQNSKRVQADMVESVLYCLMVWFERRTEIEIMFGHTVPHHEMLNISPDDFAGLLASTMEVIEQTIPASNTTQQAVWAELKTDLLALVSSSSLAELGI